MGSIQLITHLHILIAEGFLSFAQELVCFPPSGILAFGGKEDCLIVLLDLSSGFVVLSLELFWILSFVVSRRVF